MKAEPTPIQKAINQIKEAKENFPAIGFTDDYVDGFNKGMQMAEFILFAKYLKEEKEYARIQIEKDRVSESELMVIVKSESKNYHPSERTCFLEGAETVLRQLRYRPINLES